MCGEGEKITVEKRILLDTIKEYSDHTTIHGINYVFASFLSFNDRLFWFFIFILTLIFSVYLSLDAFIDWRKNMIVTRFYLFFQDDFDNKYYWKDLRILSFQWQR